jgi:hypothetical protein
MSSNFSFSQAQLQQYTQFQTQLANKYTGGNSGIGSLFSGTGLPSVSNLTAAANSLASSSGSLTTSDLSGLVSSITSGATSASDLSSLVSSVTSQAPSSSAIDPESIVQGLGLGSFSIPTPPDNTVYERFNELQMDHKSEQSEHLSDLQAEISAKRENLFATHHYEVGDDGKKTLVDGGETSAQRTERLAQEKTEREALKTRHKAEVEAYTVKAKAFSEKQLSAADSLDPAKKEAYQAELIALQKEEVEINLRQQTEILKLGTEGLPDPDDPTGSRTLDNYVDFGMNDFRQLLVKQEEKENSSPEGLQIIQYANEVTQFTSKQQAALNQLAQETGYILDPKAILEKFGGSLS